MAKLTLDSRLKLGNDLMFTFGNHLKFIEYPFTLQFLIANISSLILNTHFFIRTTFIRTKLVLIKNKCMLWKLIIILFLSRCTFFERELLCMLCTQNRNMILCNFQAVLKIELLIKKYLNIHKKLSKSVSEMEFYSI